MISVSYVLENTFQVHCGGSGSGDDDGSDDDGGDDDKSLQM